MANEFICWNCKGDGTRCDCHRKRPYHYIESYEEKLRKQQILDEIEINRLRRNLKLPPIKIFD